MLTSLWTELSELLRYGTRWLFFSGSSAVKQATLWPTLSPNICLLQLSLNSKQAWLFLPFPLLWGSNVYSGAKRGSSKSNGSNLFERKSGHSQLPNLHSLFLTPTLFFIIWSRIFCFQYLNSVLSHGNSVSCVDMRRKLLQSPPLNTT